MDLRTANGDFVIKIQHITKTEELTAFCESINDAPYIAVDTEFLREKTYYPKLCLVQIATPEHAATIDVLSESLCLDALWKTLYNPKQLKVFHAAFQDIEIFVNLHGKVPVPFFDTQIAAEFCGFSESVAYDSLVKSFCGKVLDKSSRVTDWQKRPLTDKQIAYALNDVTYLCRVYEKLNGRLEKSNRLEWCEQELMPFFDSAIYKVEPEDAWMKLKLGNLKPRSFVRAKKVAQWREKVAQEQDIPRRRVVQDDALLELAQRSPKTAKDIESTRFAKNSLRKTYWTEVVEVLEQANRIPDADLPAARVNTPPPVGFSWKTDLLKVLLKFVSEKEKLSTRLIATSSDLSDMALQGDKATIKTLQGWRYDLYGKEALLLLEGKKTLKIQNDKLIVSDCPA